MRIRKGHRCLPLAPADSSFLRKGSGKDVGVIGSGKERPDVEVVMTPVSTDNSIGCRGVGAQYVQEGAKDTSYKRRMCLGYDVEENRVSADDDSFNISLETGLEAEFPSEGGSLFTRHKTLDTTRAIFSSSITSVIEPGGQLDVLEQSLCHVCSRAGKSGVSARDAVAQIINEGLPGLNEGGARLIEQVMISFQSSSKFVKCEESGRYVLLDAPASEANKVLAASKISQGKVDSSSDMSGVVKQVQNLQSSPSFSTLGAGAVKLSEAPAVDRNLRTPKGVANISEEFVKQSKGGRDYRDEWATNQKANSSSRFRSQKAMQMDQTELNRPRCKREDGKGWRCSKPAEEGFAMCTHHNVKRSTSQGQSRQKKRKLDSGATKIIPEISIFVKNSRIFPDAVTTGDIRSPFLDDELPHDEHRPLLKAKSMKSLLAKSPKKFSHVRKAAL